MISCFVSLVPTRKVLRTLQPHCLHSVLSPGPAQVSALGRPSEALVEWTDASYWVPLGLCCATLWARQDTGAHTPVVHLKRLYQWTALPLGRSWRLPFPPEKVSHPGKTGDCVQASSRCVKPVSSYLPWLNLKPVFWGRKPRVLLFFWLCDWILTKANQIVL